jgi:hypothetical protein
MLAPVMTWRRCLTVELSFASVLNTKNTTTEHNKTVRAQSHLVDINWVYMHALNGRNKSIKGNQIRTMAIDRQPILVNTAPRIISIYSQTRRLQILPRTAALTAPVRGVQTVAQNHLRAGIAAVAQKITRYNSEYRQ